MVIESGVYDFRIHRSTVSSGPPSRSGRCSTSSAIVLSTSKPRPERIFEAARTIWLGPSGTRRASKNLILISFSPDLPQRHRLRHERATRPAPHQLFQAEQYVVGLAPLADAADGLGYLLSDSGARIEPGDGVQRFRGFLRGGVRLACAAVETDGGRGGQGEAARGDARLLRQPRGANQAVVRTELAPRIAADPGDRVVQGRVLETGDDLQKLRAVSGEVGAVAPGEAALAFLHGREHRRADLGVADGGGGGKAALQRSEVSGGGVAGAEGVELLRRPGAVVLDGAQALDARERFAQRRPPAGSGEG